MSLITQRKNDHIRINLEEDVAFERLTTGLERYRFVHQALPEIALEEVQTETTFLGKHLSFPFIIASMTGGSAHAARFNRMWAEAAQAAGLGMGLGSMRIALQYPEAQTSFQVRRYAPDILLLANLGAVQFNYGYGVEECRQVVEMVEADGLVLHINPLQEALQPEGDTRYDNLLPKIEQVCRALEVPVIVKEVGWGLSQRVTRLLLDAGVAALDVAGAGGTSWSQVEMYRSQTILEREVAAAFRDWGIPTVESLQMVRQVDEQVPLIASGGLRTGIDIAKSLALGADVGSMARPLLQAAAESEATLQRRIEVLHRQFRLAMYLTGARDVTALKGAPLLHQDE
ncbi:MAG: type 2 isopentenyl-diphosphate Delta-isomerase [Anaerolineales bacterium]